MKGNTGIERESGMSRTHKTLSFFFSISLSLSTYIPRVTCNGADTRYALIVVLVLVVLVVSLVGNIYHV